MFSFSEDIVCSFPEEHGGKLMVGIVYLFIWLTSGINNFLLISFEKQIIKNNRPICDYMGTKCLLHLCYTIWSGFAYSLLFPNSQAWSFSL